MTVDERHAIRIDAAQRLKALHHEHRALWADRDDPEVLSEIVTVEALITRLTTNQTTP